MFRLSGHKHSITAPLFFSDDCYNSLEKMALKGVSILSNATIIIFRLKSEIWLQKSFTHKSGLLFRKSFLKSN